MTDNNNDEIPVNMTGWNWFDTVEQAARKKTQQKTNLSAQDIIFHFEKCFATRSGKIVIDHLLDLINSTDDFDAAMGFHNGAAHGFEKTGMRRLFKYITKLATRGENK